MRPSEGPSYLIRGGTVFDGRAFFEADVWISGDAVSFPGKRPPQKGVRLIDAKGLCVSAGFIDTHGHSDFGVLRERPESKIYQGITTEINGNCGLSAAPLIGEALVQRAEDLRGIPQRWSTMDEYFGALEKKGLSLNFASLAGHGNIRASVMGYEDRAPSKEEMARMKGLLKDCLDAGALGLSTGLIYPPGVYSKTDELIALSRHGVTISKGGRAPFVYASHMRSEGDRLIRAIKEVIKIGKKAGVKVHISHIKTAGRRNWHKAAEAVSLMQGARREGIALTCDRYPYTAASTDLDSVLPSWVYEGGKEAEIKRLKDPAVRKRIKTEFLSRFPEKELLDLWERVVVSTVSLRKNRPLEGKSILRIARSLGKEPLEALMELLIEEGLRVDAIFHSMSEENLERFLSLPFVMIGSDSSARPMRPAGKPHPRAFGTFPRFLGRYARDKKRALYKMTALPARTFGLKDRGRLKEGFKADIVVFDPERIIDGATYERPFRRPEGIIHVFVNGAPVLMDGELTGERPGRVLRHGR